jgi:hypothetical protein
MNEITNSNILNSKYSLPSTWDIAHRNCQTIGRGYQGNLSSNIKKRNLHNPSFRSTHSFNPVLHFLHKKNIKLPVISSSNG